MQSMAQLVAKLASLGGNNYILSGCVTTGSNVAAGTVVINGEILPFLGGAVETYVVIEETKRSVTAEGQVFEELYVSRSCRFGTGTGQLAWADLKRVPDVFTMSEAIDALAQDFESHVNDHHVTWGNVDDKPSIFNGQILWTGTVIVGDVTGDKILTVNFDNLGTDAYIVTGSLRSVSSNWNNDNDVIWMTRNYQFDSFQLLLHETSSDVQDLRFDYALIKKQ
jgi:hypothetical protein